VKPDYTAAVAQLTRGDQQLRALVDVVGPCTMGWGRTRRPHFAELARMICYQQLAGAAARTIHGRFEALFDGHPTPEAVLAVPDAPLRAAGLSAAKAASIRDLAVRVDAGEVKLARMGRLPDDEVVRELTLVRGIGRWTAEMFLMFQLGRPDVWPIDDLGVRKGYSRIYGLPEMPRARDLEPLGEPFRPYRSVVAWYCWRAVDTVVPG
jgi:DNA-3-methyladenine glycosylase II